MHYKKFNRVTQKDPAHISKNQSYAQKQLSVLVHFKILQVLFPKTQAL